MPLLHKKLIEIISSENVNDFDLWVAKMFLIPKSDSVYRIQVARGEAVANTVMEIKNTRQHKIYEFAAEFYRLGSIRLFSMTKEGFLPKVERYIKSKSFVSRILDESYLRLRLPPVEVKVWEKVKTKNLDVTCKGVLNTL